MLELTYVAATSRVDRLTKRQRMVLRMIADGESEKLMAARLGMSVPELSSLSDDLFHTLGLRPTRFLDQRLLAVLTLRQASARGPARR